MAKGDSQNIKALLKELLKPQEFPQLDSAEIEIGPDGKIRITSLSADMSALDEAIRRVIFNDFIKDVKIVDVGGIIVGDGAYKEHPYDDDVDELFKAYQNFETTTNVVANFAMLSTARSEFINQTYKARDQYLEVLNDETLAKDSKNLAKQFFDLTEKEKLLASPIYRIGDKALMRLDLSEDELWQIVQGKKSIERERERRKPVSKKISEGLEVITSLGGEILKKTEESVKFLKDRDHHLLAVPVNVAGGTISAATTTIGLAVYPVGALATIGIILADATVAAGEVLSVPASALVGSVAGGLGVGTSYLATGLASIGTGAVVGSVGLVGTAIASSPALITGLGVGLGGAALTTASYVVTLGATTVVAIAGLTGTGLSYLGGRVIGGCVAGGGLLGTGLFYVGGATIGAGQFLLGVGAVAFSYAGTGAIALGVPVATGTFKAAIGTIATAGSAVAYAVPTVALACTWVGVAVVGAVCEGAVTGLALSGFVANNFLLKPLILGRHALSGIASGTKETLKGIGKTGERIFQTEPPAPNNIQRLPQRNVFNAGNIGVLDVGNGRREIVPQNYGIKETTLNFLADGTRTSTGFFLKLAGANYFCANQRFNNRGIRASVTASVIGELLYTPIVRPIALGCALVCGIGGAVVSLSSSLVLNAGSEFIEDARTQMIPTIESEGMADNNSFLGKNGINVDKKIAELLSEADKKLRGFFVKKDAIAGGLGAMQKISDTISVYSGWWKDQATAAYDFLKDEVVRLNQQRTKIWVDTSGSRDSTKEFYGEMIKEDTNFLPRGFKFGNEKIFSEAWKAAGTIVAVGSDFGNSIFKKIFKESEAGKSDGGVVSVVGVEGLKLSSQVFGVSLGATQGSFSWVWDKTENIREKSWKVLTEDSLASGKKAWELGGDVRDASVHAFTYLWDSFLPKLYDINVERFSSWKNAFPLTTDVFRDCWKKYSLGGFFDSAVTLLKEDIHCIGVGVSASISGDDAKKAKEDSENKKFGKDSFFEKWGRRVITIPAGTVGACLSIPGGILKVCHFAMNKIRCPGTSIVGAVAQGCLDAGEYGFENLGSGLNWKWPKNLAKTFNQYSENISMNERGTWFSKVREEENSSKHSSKHKVVKVTFSAIEDFVIKPVVAVVGVASSYVVNVPAAALCSAGTMMKDGSTSEMLNSNVAGVFRAGGEFLNTVGCGMKSLGDALAKPAENIGENHYAFPMAEWIKDKTSSAGEFCEDRLFKEKLKIGPAAQPELPSAVQVTKISEIEKSFKEKGLNYSFKLDEKNNLVITAPRNDSGFVLSSVSKSLGNDSGGKIKTLTVRVEDITRLSEIVSSSKKGSSSV